ncbi:MAG: hypothetical protein NVS1B10_01070 [Candidatus Saccharimonadales bacterium]
MQEKYPGTPEKSNETLYLPTEEQAEPLRVNEAAPQKAEAVEAARDKIAETIESEPQANPIEALKAQEKATESASPTHINQELKQTTKNRQLYSIRRQLPFNQKVLSKVIHQPAIRVISEVAGQTVSRPSGLLGGGLVALIGTSSYLYLARHMGFQYNYLVFLMLLVAGFILGLILELIVHLLTSSRRHQND